MKNEIKIQSCLNHRNLNKLYGYLEHKKVKVPFTPSWHRIISIIVDAVLNKKNYNIKKFPDLIKEIRDLLYQLFITNIDFHIIIKEIMNDMKSKISDNEIKYKIIEETSKFENRISQGTRHIIHLEAYLIKVIQIINL
jgi:FKBP-type peptidyl-prolyl cis-trans isomerase (trigger factor)